MDRRHAGNPCRPRGIIRMQPNPYRHRAGNGGHRTRTCTGLRPAVFKTAALPVRSSPPELEANLAERPLRAANRALTGARAHRPRSRPTRSAPRRTRGKTHPPRGRWGRPPRTRTGRSSPPELEANLAARPRAGQRSVGGAKRSLAPPAQTSVVEDVNGHARGRPDLPLDGRE